MDPETPTTDTTPPAAAQEPAPPAAAPAAQEPSTPAPKLLQMTQEQYNAAMAAARRDGQAQAEKKAKPSTPQPQAAPAQPAANPDADRPVTRAELDAMKRETKFAHTLVEKGLKLSELQRNALLPHFNIGDPDSIVGVAHDLFPHLNAPAAPATPSMPSVPVTPKNGTPPGVATPAAPSYVSPGAPSGSPDAGLDTDPTSWSRDQVRAYEADGTLMARVEAWKARMPGGAAQSIFPNRAPPFKR
jgi:hypothetical protein